MSKWALTLPIWIAIGSLLLANAGPLGAAAIAVPSHGQSTIVPAISPEPSLPGHSQSSRFAGVNKSPEVDRIRPGPVEFQTIFDGAGHAAAGVTEINDAQTWAAFWQRNCGVCTITIASSGTTVTTVPPTPQIDFRTQTVIVASPGLEGNPGVHININSITDHAHHLIIDATRTNPGNYCLEAQVVTFPEQIVVIPKTNLSPIFDMNTVTGPPCPL